MDILLKRRTGDWISIENAGGRNSVKTAEFLAKANAAGSFEHVCFGDRGIAYAATYAIKSPTSEPISGFIGWAWEHGLKAEFERAA